MDAKSTVGVLFGEQHFGAARLGDQRLTDRLVHTANLLVAHPGGTFPAKLNTPADLDGFYRLMASPKVTHAAVLAPHQQRTWQQMREHDGVVLIVHDTTVLDYSGLHEIKELGQIGDGNGRGYYCHNSLAVTEDGQVLGLAHQEVHTRRRVPKGETKAQRQRRPDRESRWWKKSSEAIPVAPPGKLWVDVADRGADITEFLDYEEQQGKKYLVRSAHNRRVELEIAGKTECVKLHDFARTLVPAATTREITVSAKAGQPARKATLAVAWMPVTLLPPRQPRGDERGAPLPCVVLRVWELQPPPGVEPIEWILLTNVAVTDDEAAWQRVRWYTRRWIVEEYHKAKKTGCNIEQMQFEYADRLKPAIALVSIVALLLLNLRDVSRCEKQRELPARTLVPVSWVRVLAAWRYGEPRDDLTVGEFFYALARLGGHQNRKHDHPPGWLVLWRGWTELQALHRGALAMGTVRCEET
jgi:hypothetical protein